MEILFLFYFTIKRVKYRVSFVDINLKCTNFLGIKSNDPDIELK